jgi:hypothetical protein
MSNILERQMHRLYDRYKDSSHVDIFEKLYQLTEDVSIAYENWKTEESSFTKRYSYDDDNNGKWYDEFDNSLGRKYYTDKQLFQYFINNIYKP